MWDFTSKASRKLSKKKNKNIAYIVVFKIDCFEPSSEIDLEAIGGTFDIILIGQQDDEDYMNQSLQFVASISKGPVPFEKTTFLTIQPKYVVINKLPIPIVIQQVFRPREKSKLDPLGKKELPPDLENVRNFEPAEKDKNGKVILENFCNKRSFHLVKAPDKEFLERINVETELVDNQIEFKPEDGEEWSLPFAITDIEDFQCENKYNKNGKEWYEPNEETGMNLITRVIISHEQGSMFIIFEQPTLQEFIFHNQTNLPIFFRKYNKKGRVSLDKDATKAKPDQRMPFTWGYRENLVKHLKVYISADPRAEYCIISLDQHLNSEQKVRAF